MVVSDAFLSSPQSRARIPARVESIPFGGVGRGSEFRGECVGPCRMRDVCRQMRRAKGRKTASTTQSPRPAKTDQTPKIVNVKIVRMASK